MWQERDDRVRCVALVRDDDEHRITGAGPLGELKSPSMVALRVCVVVSMTEID